MGLESAQDPQVRMPNAELGTLNELTGINILHHRISEPLQNWRTRLLIICMRWYLHRLFLDTGMFKALDTRQSVETFVLTQGEAWDKSVECWGDQAVDVSAIPIPFEQAAEKIVKSGKDMRILRRFEQRYSHGGGSRRGGLSEDISSREPRWDSTSFNFYCAIFDKSLQRFGLDALFVPTTGILECPQLLSPANVSSWLSRCSRMIPDDFTALNKDMQSLFTTECYSTIAVDNYQLKYREIHNLHSAPAAQLLGFISPATISATMGYQMEADSTPGPHVKRDTAHKLTDSRQTPLPSTTGALIRKEMHDPLLRVLAQTSYKCTRLFLKQLSLERYVKMCGALFLLGETAIWGSFLENLLNYVTVGLPKRSMSGVSKSNMDKLWSDDNFVNADLRSSILEVIGEQKCSRYLAKGFTDPIPGSDVTPIDRLRITLTNTCRQNVSYPVSRSADICTSLLCFNGFELEWDLQWPLNLVLDRAGMQRYNLLFNYLCQVAYVRRCLEDITADILKNVRTRFSAQVSKRSTRIEKWLMPIILQLGHMRHFVRGLTQFLMTHIHCTSWKTFRRQLYKCLSVENLRFLHMGYLSHIESAAYICKDAILSILQNILCFISTLPSCCSALLACLEVNEAGVGGHDYARQALEPATGYSVGFDTDVQHLLSDLARVERRRDRASTSAAAANLRLILDYNYHYSSDSS